MKRNSVAGLIIVAALLSSRMSIAQQDFSPGKYYSSPFGKRTTVTLPDRTVVVLNSNTTVTLDKKFNLANRTVSMSGDALFRIAAGVKTFRILTPHLILTTSQKTTARVNGYAGTAGEVTFVLSGKLHATKSYYSALDHEPYDLGTGEMAMMNKDIDLMEKETFALAEQTPWVNDSLVLKNCTLPQLTNILRDWFNADLEIAAGSKPVPDRQYSGIFHHPSLQEVLGAIGKAWGFTASSRGNTVFLKF